MPCGDSWSIDIAVCGGEFSETSPSARGDVRVRSGGCSQCTAPSSGELTVVGVAIARNDAAAASLGFIPDATSLSNSALNRLHSKIVEVSVSRAEHLARCSRQQTYAAIAGSPAAAILETIGSRHLTDLCQLTLQPTVRWLAACVTLSRFVSRA